MRNINFWNGNKSPARQRFELDILSACLSATQEQYGAINIIESTTDYPDAEDEGTVFERQCDVLVTVAGNVKFASKPKYVINLPICKGLLGYRLLITRNADMEKFARLRRKSQLQALSVGIPATWADAELFRSNHFNVVEKGSLNDLCARLQQRQFDYIALGANEIESLYTELAAPLGALAIEPTKLLYYPMPLVFYVNPARPDLAERLERGLLCIMANGTHQAVFNQYHADVIKRLNLPSRQRFCLDNPNLPNALNDFTPTIMT